MSCNRAAADTPAYPAATKGFLQLVWEVRRCFEPNQSGKPKLKSQGHLASSSLPRKIVARCDLDQDTYPAAL
jgi:hypothetical protein